MVGGAMPGWGGAALACTGDIRARPRRMRERLPFPPASATKATSSRLAAAGSRQRRRRQALRRRPRRPRQTTATRRRGLRTRRELPLHRHRRPLSRLEAAKRRRLAAGRRAATRMRLPGAGKPPAGGSQQGSSPVAGRQQGTSSSLQADGGRQEAGSLRAVASQVVGMERRSRRSPASSSSSSSDARSLCLAAGRRAPWVTGRSRRCRPQCRPHQQQGCQQLEQRTTHLHLMPMHLGLQPRRCRPRQQQRRQGASLRSRPCRRRLRRRLPPCRQQRHLRRLPH